MKDQVKIVPKGKGIIACDAEGNTLSDAKVLVNGEAVHYDPVFFQHRLQKDTPAPFDLRIEHPGHPDIHIPRFFYDTQKVFLLGESAACIWQNGVRTPVLAHKASYFLTLKNQHQHGEAEQDAFDQQVETWTGARQGKIGRVFMGEEEEIAYRKLTLGQADADMIAELAAKDPIDFIGPLLHLPTQDHLPAGLTNQVEIKFLPGTEQDKIDALIQKIELIEVQSTQLSDGLAISGRFKGPADWSVVSKVTHLNALDHIRFANNVLLIQETY